MRARLFFCHYVICGSRGLVVTLFIPLNISWGGLIFERFLYRKHLMTFCDNMPQYLNALSFLMQCFVMCKIKKPFSPTMAKHKTSSHFVRKDL